MPLDNPARRANPGMEPEAAGAAGAHLGLLARTAGWGRSPGRGSPLQELTAKALSKAQVRHDVLEQVQEG